jgi:hypothetical protein
MLYLITGTLVLLRTSACAGFLAFATAGRRSELGQRAELAMVSHSRFRADVDPSNEIARHCHRINRSGLPLMAVVTIYRCTFVRATWDTSEAAATPLADEQALKVGTLCASQSLAAS